MHMETFTPGSHFLLPRGDDASGGVPLCPQMPGSRPLGNFSIAVLSAFPAGKLFVIAGGNGFLVESGPRWGVTGERQIKEQLNAA